jgi:two-component SAPR family response regulator
MINQVITRVSLDSFREKSAGKKIVLLYPWSNYRQLFLTHFLASEGEGLLYYCIPHGTKTLKGWMQDLKQQLGEILDGFGENLSQLGPKSSSEKIAKAFVADLGKINSDRVVLFIDELDRVRFDDDFNTFIKTVVELLPKHVQLAFSSRLLTRLTWYDFVVKGDAVVLGTEFRKNDIMFTIEDDLKPQVEVYGFGRGHAFVNGEEITTWDGALPRNLFFYFIDNNLVTRDDIFSTFWPNLSVKEATNVFHVTKRKISERITMKVGDDEQENYELTLYSAGFYMPSDKIVRHYDVEDFVEAIEQATTSEDERERERLYRHAVDLYKAPFLETIKMQWVEERRNYLRQLQTQALVGLGRINRKRGDIDEALGFYTRAAKESPEREDTHREIILIYAEKGMKSDAKKQYDTLKKILKENYGITPSPEIQAIYDSL